MTIDATLEALLEDAKPGLHDAIRTVLRRAYDAGYREALATAHGAPAQPAAPLATPLAAPVPPAVQAPPDDDDLEPEDAPPSAVGRALEGAADDPEEDDDPTPPVDWGTREPQLDAEPEPEPRVARPIFPHATVGTLRRRIATMFDLERFDIDVVICRKGDPKRRQLKQTVKLSRYLVEG